MTDDVKLTDENSLVSDEQINLEREKRNDADAIDALKQVVEMLRPLNKRQRRRVMLYIADYFGYSATINDADDGAP